MTETFEASASGGALFTETHNRAYELVPGYHRRYLDTGDRSYIQTCKYHTNTLRGTRP